MLVVFRPPEVMGQPLKNVSRLFAPDAASASKPEKGVMPDEGTQFYKADQAWQRDRQNKIYIQPCQAGVPLCGI